MVLGSAVLMVVVSLFTRPPSRETIQKYFGPRHGAIFRPDRGCGTWCRDSRQGNWLRVCGERLVSLPPHSDEIKFLLHKCRSGKTRRACARNRRLAFFADTGCPFWLDWATKHGKDPRQHVKSFADLLAFFPHFRDEWLRDLQPEVWVPAAFKGRPYNIFETGGTTGMPSNA